MRLPCRGDVERSQFPGTRELVFFLDNHTILFIGYVPKGKEAEQEITVDTAKSNGSFFYADTRV